jgi:hypothetical protein
MKHNNSNQSISGKKFVPPVNKPSGVAAGVVIQGGNGKKNYMSPYS